jgi:hypothetical protein
MGFTLICNNDLAMSFNEVHNFISNLVKNNVTIPNIMSIYIDPIPDSNECVSTKRNDIKIKNYGKYKVANGSVENIPNIDYEELKDYKLIKIYFPLKNYDYYLGTIILAKNNNNDSEIKIINGLS